MNIKLEYSPITEALSILKQNKANLGLNLIIRLDPTNKNNFEWSFYFDFKSPLN